MFRLKVLVFSSFFVFLLVAAQNASAQESPDSFFRPVKSTDLNTRLAPRFNQKKLLGGSGDSDFLSYQGGGCPDEINIGSVTQGGQIFGSTNIDVFIDGGLTIQCGR